MADLGIHLIRAGDGQTQRWFGLPLSLPRGDQSSSAVFSADGQLVATGEDVDGADFPGPRRVLLWRMMDGSVVNTFGPFPGGGAPGSFAATLAPDGSRILAAWSNRLVSFDARTGAQLPSFPVTRASSFSSFSRIGFSADARRVAYGDSPLTVYDTDTGKMVVQLADGGEPWLSADGNVIAIRQQSAVRVYKVADMTSRNLVDTGGMVTNVAVSDDGSTVATLASDLRLWRASDGTLLRTVPLPSGVRATALRLAADGTRLLVYPVGFLQVADGTWADLPNGWPAGVLQGVSPDLSRLVIGQRDRATTATVWDIGARTPVRRLRGHAFSVSALAFTPDGTAIVSASPDLLQLTRSSDGAVLDRFDVVTPHDPYPSVVLSRDGTKAAIGPLLLCKP
jgi:WD40 repeat protein